MGFSEENETNNRVVECPKCGSKTFMLIPRAGIGYQYKGKCYKCGHEQGI